MGDAGSCDHPLGIDVQTIDGIPASETGEVFKMLKPDKGFVCLNQDQVSFIWDDLYLIGYVKSGLVMNDSFSIGYTVYFEDDSNTCVLD